MLKTHIQWSAFWHYPCPDLYILFTEDISFPHWGFSNFRRTDSHGKYKKISNTPKGDFSSALLSENIMLKPGRNEFMVKAKVYQNSLWLAIPVYMRYFSVYNIRCFLLPESCRFVALLTLQPEDGGGIILWNVSWLSLDYMAFYLRRCNSFKWFKFWIHILLE